MSLLFRTTDVMSARKRCCSPGPDSCRGILPCEVVAGQHKQSLHNRLSGGSQGGLMWKCFSFMSMFFRFYHACASALLMLRASSHTPAPTEKNKTSVHRTGSSRCSSRFHHACCLY